MMKIKQITMRKQCRVLLELADCDDCLTTKQLAARIGYSDDQIRTVLGSLIRKRKVERIYGPRPDGLFDLGKGASGYKYKYSEQDPLPNVSGKRGRPARSTLREAALAPIAQANTPKLYRQKLDLLERLLDQVGGNDRDVMLAIIRDYRMLNSRGSYKQSA